MSDIFNIESVLKFFQKIKCNNNNNNNNNNNINNNNNNNNLYLQVQAVRKFNSTRCGPMTSCSSHCILLLNYKITLREYDTYNTEFVGLQVCAVGKYDL
jgi:hypothetical protein